MYRSSKYELSEQSLKVFAKLFNEESKFNHIKIYPIEKETFIDDGYIKNELTNQTIGFDWEIRDRYFENGVFKFDTLGQFERKIIKPSIELSIQCDKNQTAVLVAWHQDWKNENLEMMRLSTDNADQIGKVRYTKHFKIYRYANISELKAMIDRAFENGEFNHSSF